MRILKYILLLFLLFTVATSVYIITQKGSFEVTQTGIINTKKSTVFDYVNDYKNWETFGSWMSKQDPILFQYPAKTMGAGAHFTWEHHTSSGSIKTYFVKEGDSIAQVGNFSGTEFRLYWKFKESPKGTSVTVHCKGTMNAYAKFASFFKGGIHSLAEKTIAKSLENLDRTMAYEMKTYAIKVDGIVSRNATYCLQQTISCKIQKVTKNIKIMLPRMVYFFKKNNLTMAGKPFVQYQLYDEAKDIATIMVGVPIAQEAFVASGSDIGTGQLQAFTCLKTTLTGDYSHRNEAWKKAKKYIADHHLTENFAGNYVEVYTLTIDEVKSPSKWKTEIYIPIFPVAETKLTPTDTLTKIDSLSQQ